MSGSDDETREQPEASGPQAVVSPSTPLSAREVRRALAGLPGWKPWKYSRQLGAEFRFRKPEDAAAFVVVAVVLAFETGLFPELEWISRAVTVTVTEPQALAVTPRVVALAHRLSALAGSPGLQTTAPAPSVLAGIVQDLTARASKGGSGARAGTKDADPVAGMLVVFATLEATLRAFVPWLEEARLALAPVLPDDEEMARRAQSDTLTRPMQLETDARLLLARLDPLLALVRTARQITPNTAEAEGEPDDQRPTARLLRALAGQGALRQEDVSDDTQDLTPHLTPKPDRGPAEP